MFRQGLLAAVGSIAVLPVFWGPAGAGEAAWQAEILRKLERPMTFKGREAAAPMLSLERAVGCKIIRDKSFRRGNVPVVFAHGMPARAVLDWVCHFRNGEWMLRDGGIVLCSAEEAWRLHQHPKRVYDLTLAGLPPGDAEALRKLAEQILGPPSGAFGGRATLTPDGRLEIIAPQAKQQVIAHLVKALKTLPPSQSTGRPIPRRPMPSIGPRAASSKGPKGLIHTKLQEKTTLELKKAPLAEVLGFVSQKHKLTMVYDWRAVHPEPPRVSLKEKDVTLGTIVERLPGVHHFAAEDALVITNWDKARALALAARPATLQVHDVTDILAVGWTRDEVVKFLGIDRDEKTDLVAAVGSRVVLRLRSEHGRAYAEWALRAMRLPRDAPSPGLDWLYNQEPRWRPVYRGTPSAPEHVWKPRLRKELDKPVSLGVARIPVEDLVSYLGSLVEVTIVLDREAIRPGPPPGLTMCLRKVPCRLALDYLCCGTGLRWAMKDEAVFIARLDRTYDRPLLRMVRIPGIARTPAAARSFARFVESVLRKAQPLDRQAEPFEGWKPVYAAKPGYHLVVAEPGAQQKFIAELCRGLAGLRPGQHRALPDPTVSLESFGSPRQCVTDKMPPEVAARLKRVADFDLGDVTLHKALSEIGLKAEAALILDPEPKLLKQKVTLRGKRLRLAEALQRVEKQAAAAHLPLPHGLLVTTRQRAPRLRPTTWILYDVRNAAPDEGTTARLALALEAACKKHTEWAGCHFIARWKRYLLVRTAPAIHTAIQGKLGYERKPAR